VNSSAEAAPASAVSLARLKVRLLAEGLRIGDDVGDTLARDGRPRLRVRSGSCGGLDLILPDGSYVNCPVDELFAATSPLVLRHDGEWVITDETGRDEPVPVTPAPRPAYYDRRGSDGVPLRQIGQVCSDRLGVGLTNGCVYWAKAESRCQFCSIGLNVRNGNEIGQKRLPAILEVVEAAVSDPVAPATHVLLGGGTPPGPDAGALAIAAATRAIKARWPDLLVYAMIAPPAEPRFVDELVEAGVDELGMNIEVFSDSAGERYLPAKRGLGLATYLRMLEVAVAAFAARFGTRDPRIGRVRSIMIVGLEDAQDTLRGVEALASRGVMPILTPLRPMRGTPLETHPQWPAEALWELTGQAAAVADRYGLPLGPTCIPCQANTLNVPGHPAYRAY
jgi:hypothetical protein